MFICINEYLDIPLFEMKVINPAMDRNSNLNHKFLPI